MRGVAGERLVFAHRLPDKAAHLARHAQADLLLDSFTINASTTALDALWAGLPVLTKRGDRFPGPAGRDLPPQSRARRTGRARYRSLHPLRGRACGGCAALAPP
ncbi:MAG: hypothetical protein WDN69_14875 [Aliidongia sp.]